MHDTPLLRNINTYFAVLIITVFGAGAALIIMHVANNVQAASFASGSSGAGYSQAVNELNRTAVPD